MDDILEIILDRKVVVPILIIISASLIYLFFSKIIKRLLNLKLSGVRFNDRRQKTTLGLINNIVKYFIAIVALLMILDVYGIDTKSLLASLGVISLVAGLALQDFLKDIISGFSIIFEDQYAVGDIVTIGDFKGKVTYLGVKSTRLKAFTGETLIISNRNIDRIINHSLENSTSYLDMPISYDTDIDMAKEVLLGVCDELNHELELTSEASICGVQELKDSSISIRIQFSCIYANKIKYERLFYEKAKKAFDANGIVIPFTQVVIHNGK